MIDRRNFLQMAVGAAAAAHARPITAAASRGILGANDRVRVGLIGCGSRGNQVARDWMKHKDSVFVAACDVYKERLDETVARIAGVQGSTHLRRTRTTGGFSSARISTPCSSRRQTTGTAR